MELIFPTKLGDNNAINADAQKLRCAPLFGAG